jgi:anaerobic magnesium-protoporphyrin IX monomethyl ester cyclase
VTSILLVYPYFRPRWDRSVFRFPPLGLAYVAASLRQAGHSVRLLDGTFLSRNEALRQALDAQAEVAGFYCMATMIEDCLGLAKELRPTMKLLVAGGPYPTWNPAAFLGTFDVVVRGEGERTAVDLLRAFTTGESFDTVPGIVYRTAPIAGKPAWTETPARESISDPDTIPFPARDLLPNDAYIRHGRKQYGYSVTTVLSTRGCPFHCEFCSNIVFGGSYRERSAENVLAEVEQALALGYDRISFTDDVFTMRAGRVMEICEKIRAGRTAFEWECLGRVDALDEETARAMRGAGCRRIYFGIESGNERILKMMDKRITPARARAAVESAQRAGLEVGAFFILFYPGETDATVLETLRFAGSLPLDYIGLSMPYPLPGTALYERVKEKVGRFWKPGGLPMLNHHLTYRSDFSEAKMQFGIFKGQVHHRLRRAGGIFRRWPLAVFDAITDRVLVWMK